MDEALRKQLKPGATVKVTQQIPHGTRVWTNDTTGVVVSYAQKQTGSWYAHGKDDKFWLDRLTLRRPDGELSTLSLDEYSRVEVQSQAPEGKPGDAAIPAA